MKARPFPFFRIVACGVLLAFAAACAKAPDDAKVTSDIQAKLAADSGLQDKQLTVQSSNGTVTLSGAVDSQAERDAAAKYAAAETGVKTVVNNLQVGSTESAAQAATAPTRTKPSASTSRRKSYKRSNDAAQADAPATLASTDQSASPSSQSQSGAQAPAAQVPATPPPPPQPAPVTVPSGAVVPVRLIDPIDSATAQPGDSFHATLDAPI